MRSVVLHTRSWGVVDSEVVPCSNARCVTSRCVFDGALGVWIALPGICYCANTILSKPALSLFYSTRMHLVVAVLAVHIYIDHIIVNISHDHIFVVTPLVKPTAKRQHAVGQ